MQNNSSMIPAPRSKLPSNRCNLVSLTQGMPSDDTRLESIAADTISANPQVCRSGCFHYGFFRQCFSHWREMAKHRRRPPPEIVWCFQQKELENAPVIPFGRWNQKLLFYPSSTLVHLFDAKIDRGKSMITIQLDENLGWIAKQKPIKYTVKPYIVPRQSRVRWLKARRKGFPPSIAHDIPTSHILISHR